MLQTFVQYHVCLQTSTAPFRRPRHRHTEVFIKRGLARTATGVILLTNGVGHKVEHLAFLRINLGPWEIWELSGLSQLFPPKVAAAYRKLTFQQPLMCVQPHCRLIIPPLRVDYKGNTTTSRRMTTKSEPQRHDKGGIPKTIDCCGGSSPLVVCPGFSAQCRHSSPKRWAYPSGWCASLPRAGDSLGPPPSAL